MMRKIFTLVFLAFIAIVARAADYTEPIVVTVNGNSSEQSATISVEQKSTTYDLTLKNFVLATEDGTMGVGNVVITGIEPVKVGDTVLLQTSRIVTVAPGDNPNTSSWIASALPPVPVNLVCKLENGHLRCHIDIDMTETLQQVIEVTVGKGYQLQNRSFENWHTSMGEYVEPNGWHSFESASGSLASLAGHHIKKSDDAHSGSASACVFSTSILGIVANGTMTTGRLNAGSMIAADVSNNAYIDMSRTDVDGNGHPFYTPMYSRPDSIAVWVKFKQGEPDADNPYATISAVITDGTYYQDPEDKEYTNVVAKAKNDQIAQTDGEWVRVVVPFEYMENTVNPKAILVTLSTNANPGKGSKGDELLIDDMELIYNAKLTSLKVKGQEVDNFDSNKLSYEMTVNEPLTIDDIEAVADGKAALIEKKIAIKDNRQECQIIVYGGDLGKVTTYTIVAELQATVSTNKISSGDFAGYWSTYYNNIANLQAPDGVTVYKATLSGNRLSLTEIPDRIVNKGQAVILRASTSGAITLSSTATASTGDYTDNALQGVDVATPIAGSPYASKVVYTMANEGGLGFYKYTGKELGAGKAFLALDIDAAARGCYLFGEVVTSSVNDVMRQKNKEKYYFDLQGRKVSHPKKGLYIVDDRVVVIH